MTEATKSVEIAKQEQVTPPTTPEKTANTIKERLNLHVKRRLQQEALPSLETVQHNNNNVNNNNERESQLSKRNSDKSKQPIKTRKPYQRRMEKNSDGSVRKYKRTKAKQLGSTTVGKKVSDGNDTVAPETVNILASSGAGGNGDDDGSHDGGHDTETKGASSSRDKEKCPDVLGMVLSAKKRALLQHPEVQDFLGKLMGAIRS